MCVIEAYKMAKKMRVIGKKIDQGKMKCQGKR